MIHYKPDQCYPYTYYVIHKATGASYYGVRFANYTVLKIPPQHDLGKIYFTSLGKHSSWFKRLFMKDPSQFHFSVHRTFDTVSEALYYERMMLKKLRVKNRWLNKM